MDRRAHPFQHIFFVEDLVGGMQGLEYFKMIKDLLCDGINDVIRDLRGGDKSRLHTERLNIFLVESTGVEFYGDNGLYIIGVF